MNNPFKQALLDTLDFIKHKVDNDACTPEEMQSVFRLLQEHTINKATTQDIADFYGQSKSNVRNIASRWGIKGESRRYYDFNQLQKFIPKSWRKAKAEKPQDVSYSVAAEEAPQYGKH